jgi:hypothetical protein
VDNSVNRLEQVNRIIAEEERLHKTENGKLVINHAKTADAMIKFICMAPVDNYIKRIMVMRIGSAFKNQKAQPMSHLQIALLLGETEEKIFQLEREGIVVVSEFMERVCLADGVNAFNKERSIENDVRSTLDDSKPKGNENDS